MDKLKEQTRSLYYEINRIGFLYSDLLRRTVLWDGRIPYYIKESSLEIHLARLALKERHELLWQESLGNPKEEQVCVHSFLVGGSRWFEFPAQDRLFYLKDMLTAAMEDTLSLMNQHQQGTWMFQDLSTVYYQLHRAYLKTQSHLIRNGRTDH